jgi:hypothetical protein
MAVAYGKRNLGLFTNGDFESGSNTNFSFASIYSNDAYSGCYSLLFQNNGSPTRIGSEYIKVDTSKYYRMTVRAKTIARSTPNNYLGYGYLGFATYDQFYNFIDLRHCGGVGNTTLSRALNPGDSYAYITSSAGWSTLALYYYRHFMINPATHPYYSTPWGYSRIGYGDYNICYSPTITFTGTDYQLALQDINGNAITMPNIGYSLPVGTPVFNGVAGGTYSYIWVPEFPESWTLYDSGWFTGENRNSSIPFRYGTKYITFMHLENYGRTAETTPAKYLMDEIRLYQSPISTASIPL